MNAEFGEVKLPSSRPLDSFKLDAKIHNGAIEITHINLAMIKSHERTTIKRQ